MKLLEKIKGSGSGILIEMTNSVWETRKDRVKDVYGDVLTADWSELSDGQADEALSELIGSMLKARQRRIKKEGGIYNPSVELRRIARDHFSRDSFSIAFREVAGDRSMQHIARLTGLSKSHVQKLLANKYSPSLETMQSIANGFSIDPSFFKEYRIGMVVKELVEFLENNPDSSVIWYLKVFEE